MKLFYLNEQFSKNYTRVQERRITAAESEVSMRLISLRLAFTCATLFLLLYGGHAFAASLRPVVESTQRAGLPHVAAKLKAGREVAVAYFGGSITAQNGWRDLSFNWLASQYPKAHLEQVDASLSGTGSMLGAFRVDYDVLRFHPDLIFIEFAVNDHGETDETIVRSMEGIVRKARLQYPDVDICFVYTLGGIDDLQSLQAGKDTVTSNAMESVADYYGIPSINFGPAVAALVTSGDLIFRGAKAVAIDPQPDTQRYPAGASVAVEEEKAKKPVVFSPDGVHPYTETGHQIYLQVIKRTMPTLLAAPDSSVTKLLPPMDPLNLEHATVVSPAAVHLEGDWKVASLLDDSHQMDRSMPVVYQGTRPGDMISFTFEGSLVGIYGVKGGDAGQFSVKIDDNPPISATLFEIFSLAGRYRIKPWFSPFLKPGPHTVVIEITGGVPKKEDLLRKAHPDLQPSGDYAKTDLNLGGLLVNGKFTNLITR